MRFKLRENQKADESCMLEIYVSIAEDGDAVLNVCEEDGTEWHLAYINRKTGALRLCPGLPNYLGLKVKDGKLVVE